MTTSNPNNTPDTVSELLSLNNPEVTDLDRVQEVYGSVGYEDTLTVKWLLLSELSNLLDFHTQRCSELQGEPNLEPWVKDKTVLWTVLELLKTVQ